jgi:hypothetical protein
VDRVHESVDCASPVHRGPAAIAALGRRWKSVSPATDTSARKDDGEGAMRAKRGGVGGVGGFTEGGVGFYRAEARWGRAERLQLPA